MWRKSIVVATALLVLVAQAGHAQVSAARMDEVVQSYVTNKQFMGSVLVARGDEVIFSKGYGFANLEWNIANDAVTKFRLGSVSKQFTAASVLLLEERGKLKIEDPIKKYLPDVPAAWEKITIFNLLTHTAGLPNITALPEFQSFKTQPSTVDKSILLFSGKPLEFVPGERMSYSNSGYLVLGALVEKLGGMPYEQFLQQNIFTPLGMKDSGYDISSRIIPHRASGYSPGPNGSVNAPYVDMSIPHAAGALYSTTEDLLRWERGLFGNKVLKEASVRRMTTAFKSDFALGLTVGTTNGRRAYFHGGGIEGFNALLVYYPDAQITVVALANLNGNAPQQIATRLGALAHGDPVQLQSERKEIELPVATLGRYVGTYSMAPNVNMTIRLEGAQLTSQLSGQGKVPLFAQTETVFFPKVVDAQLEFIKGTDGAVTHLVLKQNGRETRAARTSDTVAERREITLSPDKLSAFVGAYELRPGLLLTITLENGQLMSQPTGQTPAPIFPESENKFFSKRTDAQMEFERNESGTVTHLTLTQGAAKIRAPKK